MTEEDRIICRRAVEGICKSNKIKMPPRIIFVPSPFVLMFAAGTAAAIWYLRKGGANKEPEDRVSPSHSAMHQWSGDAVSRVLPYSYFTPGDELRQFITAEIATKITECIGQYYLRESRTPSLMWSFFRAKNDVLRRYSNDKRQSPRLISSYDARPNNASGHLDPMHDEQSEFPTELRQVDAMRAAVNLATGPVAGSLQTSMPTVGRSRKASPIGVADLDRPYVNISYNECAALGGRLVADVIGPHYIHRRDNTESVIRLDSDFAMGCADRVSDLPVMQWTESSDYLSFLKDVVKVRVDWSAYEHTEALELHGGPWLMQEEFCMISDRPETLLLDDMRWPHCETGPYCRWQDGTSLYAVHGVDVPAYVVERRQDITVARIEAESSLAVRLRMIERYRSDDALSGMDAYLRDAGFEIIDSVGEEHPIAGLRSGRLVRRTTDGRVALMADLRDCTPGHDGVRRRRLVNIHPECRPMWLENDELQLGAPQPLTLHAAVASTFGLRAEEYWPLTET